MEVLDINQPRTRRRAYIITQRLASFVIVSLGVAAILLVGIPTFAAPALDDTARVPEPNSSGLPQGASSLSIATAQLLGWGIVGGGGLVDEFGVIMGRLARAETEYDKYWPAAAENLLHECGELQNWSARAEAFFVVPDPSLRPLWSDGVGSVKRGSIVCMGAATGGDQKRLEDSLETINVGGRKIAAFAQELVHRVKLSQ